MSCEIPVFSEAELLLAEQAACKAVVQVGPQLRHNFGRSNFTTKSDEHDWVTEWDTWAEELIINGLQKFSGAVGIKAEESGDTGDQSVYWTVDPIDGTSHFVRGNELCSTMVALVNDGTPVVAAIYDFVRRDLYTAVQGKGAYKNARDRLQVSDRPLETSYVEVYTDEQVRGGKELIESIEARGAYTLKNASTGYTMTSVARGGIESFIALRNPYATEWDVAPGALLIQEAGGVVKNIGQDNYNVTNPDFIASNPASFDHLEIIARENMNTVSGT